MKSAEKLLAVGAIGYGALALYKYSQLSADSKKHVPSYHVPLNAAVVILGLWGMFR